QRQLPRVVDRVAGDRDPQGVADFDRLLLAADDVAGDGDEPRPARPVVGLPVNADVGPTRRDRGLDGIAGQGDLADRAGRGLEPHVGRGPGIAFLQGLASLRVPRAVVFDVVAGDLDIVHVAIEHLDAGVLVVADVVAVEDALVPVAVFG